MVCRVDRRRGWLSFKAPEGADPVAFAGACYAMTGLAYVAVSASSGRLGAVLWPKGRSSLEALARELESEYAGQLLRWAVARANQPVREEILKRMLQPAEAAGEGGFAAALTPAQRAEIDRLLAEAASAPADPLGIAAPWEEQRRRRP